MGEVEMIFKLNFNYKEFHGLRMPLPTSDHSIRRAHEYFEQCQQYASQLWGVTAFSEDEKEGFGVG